MKKQGLENFFDIQKAKAFKRKVLGLFGQSAVKTLDETARALYQTGIVSSVEEGRKIIPHLSKSELIYGYKGCCAPAPKRILFDKVGQDAVRIYTMIPHPDFYA